MDKILATTLNEVSSHTLRVTVSYSIGRGVQEVKTLRKSYRFNVLQPLDVSMSASKIGHNVAIQGCITNISKSPLLLEDAQFVVANNAGASKVSPLEMLKVPFAHTSAPDCDTREIINSESGALWEPLKDFNIEDISVVQPEEQKAFAILLTKEMMGLSDTAAFLRSLSGPIGHVEVTWCADIGERGVLKSKNVFATNIESGIATQSTLASPAPEEAKRLAIMIIPR